MEVYGTSETFVREKVLEAGINDLYDGIETDLVEHDGDGAWKAKYPRGIPAMGSVAYEQLTQESESNGRAGSWRPLKVRMPRHRWPILDTD